MLLLVACQYSVLRTLHYRRYMTASPFGDLFDVLQQPAIDLQLLSLYRVVWYAGDVVLNATQLLAFCKSGGVAVVQSGQVAKLGLETASVVGAQLGPLETHQLNFAIDTQTGWNATSAQSSSPTCVGDATNKAWYIKTGGESGTTRGWDGGKTDKCCRSSPTSCIWFDSSAKCKAALVAGARCLACRVGETDIGCPQWTSTGGATMVQSISQVDSTTEVIVSGRANRTASDTPIVIRHQVGAGSVITVLIDSAPDLQRLDVQAHVLQRISDDVTPFVLESDAIDVRSRVGMSLARTNDGWRITLVNNLGVTKLPASPATVDLKLAINVSLASKEAYGSIVSAQILTMPRQALQFLNGTVCLTIPPGDLVVIGATLSGPSQQL